MTPFSLINKKAEEYEGLMNQNTSIAYNRIWRDFSEYLDSEEVHDFEDMTKSHILKFLTRFNMKPFSYNQARSAIFKILQDISNDYHIKIDRLENIKNQVKSKKVKTDEKLFLTKNQLHEIRENIYVLFTDRSIRERNLLIFDLLYHSMMRVDEITLIQLQDIHVERKRLAIRGKGALGDHQGGRSINAYIPLTDTLMDSLHAYVKNWRLKSKADVTTPYLEYPETIHPDMPLFTSRMGNALNVSSIKKDVSKMIASLYEDGTVPKNHGAHCIRRSIATLKYKQCKDLILIQKMLRHASPETTRRYLSIDQEAVDQAFLQSI